MRVDFAHLAAGLKSLPLFDRLVSFCHGKEAYVVGGAVRDALIGLPVQDVDVISPEDPTVLAQSFAQAQGGHWFWLDAERRQSRVVFDRSTLSPVFDFAPFRAASLERDLFDRDFTINAMALSLSTNFTTAPLIDPARGWDDLQKSLLRSVSAKAFVNDPLRMVKGVRHATCLDLRIDDCTLAAMQAEVTGLHRVAPERVRQEVWKILASEHAERGLRLLAETLVGDELFAPLFSAHSGALAARLAVIRDGWLTLALEQPVVRDWLARDIEKGLSCETLLLWTFLLAQLDMGLPGRLAEKWLLSRKAKVCVKALAEREEDILEALDTISLGGRPFAWWAYGHRIDPKLWLLAVAAVGFMKKASQRDRICKWVPIVDTLDEQPPEDLVDGHWLQRALGLTPGPAMSKALQLVRNAEMRGLVDSTESARDYLLRHGKNID